MRKNKMRDLSIFVSSNWGEARKNLAQQHGVSVARIDGVLRAERFASDMSYPWCVRCNHTGAMHHDDDWNYVTGPCAEYLCECPAMDAGHD